MEGTKLHGVGFLIGLTFGADIFSALMSSPWTTRKFAQNPADAAHARRLVYLAVGGSIAAGLLASWLTANPWPFYGAATGSGFMWLQYEKALTEGAETAGQAA